MLEIVIPPVELWDPKERKFSKSKEYKLQLEHSLISISKWEARWNKSFLKEENKTAEETLDYIKCMTLTQNVPPEAYLYMTEENIDQIVEYIKAPMTATWFSEDNNRKFSREIITNEVIYDWMIEFGVPFECQKWHLNRLITLIRVRAAKSKKSKPMSEKDTLSMYREINAARRKKLNSKG